MSMEGLEFLKNRLFGPHHNMIFGSVDKRNILKASAINSCFW